MNSCSCGSAVVDALLQLRPFLLSLLCVWRLHLPSFSAFPVSFIAGPYARLHSTPVEARRVESSSESVVVIRNVYGTFNFIWIITICFRRLAEKFSRSRSLLFPTLIFYLSLALSFSLSLALCLSCSICGAFAETMSHEVGVGLLSGVLGCSCSYSIPFSFSISKCNCEFQTNGNFEFTSATFSVTSQIICLSCLQIYNVRVCV